MVHRRTLCLLATVAALGGGARSARADDTVPIDEHTALLVGRHRLELGLLSFEYGLAEWLSIGTNTPFWLSGAVTPVFAPNLHVKANFLTRPSWKLSGEVGGYYVSLSDASVGPGNVAVVPVSLFATFDVLPRLRAHLEASYDWVRAVSTRNVSKGTVGGALATRSGQLGLMVDYRVSRVVSFLVRGRWQVFSTPIELNASGMTDEFTSVTLAAELRPAHPHPAMVVGAVALTWKYVGLILGAGYGHYFIPGANVALAKVGPVPEASFWVRL